MRFRRRRAFRRRRFARRTRRTYRRHTRRVNKSYYIKLRQIDTVSADVTGAISLSFTDDISSAQDISSVTALFDLFKVRGVKIKYFPRAPNSTVSDTTPFSFAPLYTYVDTDSATIPATTAAAAIQYDNLVVKNMYRPWSRWARFPSYTAANEPLGWQDLATIVAHGGLYAWGNGYTASNTYGYIVRTYYVLVKNRR